MRLTDEQLARFQSLYKEHLGQDISKGAALEKSAKLLTIMRLIYKPMTREEFARTRERQASLTNESATN